MEEPFDGGGPGNCVDAQPGWFMCEDFEGSAPLTEWDDPKVDFLKVVSDQAYQGQQSLRLTFDSLHGGGPPLNRSIASAGVSDFYFRFYLHVSQDFVWSDVGTKLFYFDVTDDQAATLSPDGLHASWWVMSRADSLDGHAFLGPQRVAGVPDGSAVQQSYFGNPERSWIKGAWNCVELHVKLNDGPGDGLTEMWVNEERIINASHPIIYGKGVVNYLQFYRQHGIGELHYDALVFSTTRIGC